MTIYWSSHIAGRQTSKLLDYSKFLTSVISGMFRMWNCGNILTAHQGIKIVLQICLLITFLVFFGVPAIKKYQRREVMVVETSKNMDGIQLPSITIVERNTKKGAMQGSCFSLNSSVEDCMVLKTNNLSHMLKGVVLGSSKKEMQDLGKNVVVEDFAGTWQGRVFTINLPLIIGPDYNQDMLYLLLSPNYTQVELYFHEPRYFIVNENPFGPPTLLTRFNASTVGNHFQKLALTEVNELDEPADPCNTDQSYNFRACVKTSIAKEVRWSRWNQCSCAGGMSNQVGLLEWARYPLLHNWSSIQVKL